MLSINPEPARTGLARQNVLRSRQSHIPASFAAQVIALFGTGLMTVALALLAYDLAGENAGAVLGTALAIKMIVYVSLSPVAAGFASRFPRRALLVTLDLVRAGTALALPFVDAPSGRSTF